MKEFVITQKDQGRRLDKFIMNLLKSAPPSFTYKMLRKKNIVLNDRKASGSELLACNDTVKLYLSDETFEKFAAKPDRGAGEDMIRLMPQIIYEDDDIMIVNKPSGMLTQRSSSSDISLNEICLAYVRKKDPAGWQGEDFTPSVCNRLDRNTSGLVTFAKTYRGARCLSDAFAGRRMGKYYMCIAVGLIKDEMALTGTLTKDEATNKVSVKSMGDGAKILTIVRPVRHNDRLTLAEVELLTGKTHQIRAHLAAYGHPLLGDDKYGDMAVNRQYRQRYGIRSQMLVCTRLVFPDDLGLPDLAGRTVSINLPEEFDKVM